MALRGIRTAAVEAGRIPPRQKCPALVRAAEERSLTGYYATNVSRHSKKAQMSQPLGADYYSKEISNAANPALR
jgi:hypothetical protein